MKITEIITDADKPTRINLGNENTAAKAWIAKVYAKYPHTMQNNHVMVWGSGDNQQIAMFELTPSLSRRGAVEVKWFQAYPLRAGVGSRAMKDLQAMAQADGISMTLFPWDKGQVSQAKLTKFYRGLGFGPVHKGSRTMQWTPNEPGVAEAINMDIANAGFYHEQQIGDYLYKAKYWNGGLKIYAYDGAKKIGYAELMYAPMPSDKSELRQFAKDTHLESEWTEVNPKYQRQGIMSTMYAYAKMLGNSVRPSSIRTDDGMAAWKSWGTDKRYLTQGVAESLSVDVPNEEWLNDAIAYAKQKSPDRNGLPYMGKTTATVRQVQVPVSLLARLPGMRREQQNIRQADLAAIMKIMKDTHRLPLFNGQEYKPFINVAYDGSAWVNEGNHRIMAADQLGFEILPVQISYFDGGERVKSGLMFPGKIGL